MSVSLRTAVAGDQAFLERLYGSTRVQELAMVDWTEAQKDAFVAMQFAAQSAHYAKHYPTATFDLVLCDGERAGRLIVDRWDAEIRIVDIIVAPEFRGRGIGSELLDAVLEEADGRGDRVTIHVERTNRALSLYRRLGFAPISENGIYLLMERPACVTTRD